MGSLYWQLDDCWPVASWSSLDYFGRWKALQYYAKRFYSPVLVSTSEEGDEVGVHVVSDRTTPAAATLEATLLDLAGTALWERKLEVTIAPLASERHLALSRAELLSGRDPKAVFLQVRLLVRGQVLSENARFFVPPKDMLLGRPRIAAEVAAVDGGFSITLGTDTLARHVRLAYAPDDGFFADNYFDLVPGRPVEVLYRQKDEVELEAFRTGLQIVSLVDAF
jgi:beta-mannosidase